MLIESFHSGRRGQRRYCSLHRPVTRLVRSTGIVLCYPLGHEYFRAHRSYVKLADQLARLGFPVMRFDYVGTGDSEGDVGHDRLDSWLNDISAVADELKQSEGITDIALGGLRAGGTLALIASQRIDAVRSLILWEPVTNGERYVQDLRRLHAHMLNDLERFARARSRDDSGDGEFIGSHYPACLLRELEQLSTNALAPPDACDISLVGNADALGWHKRIRAAPSVQDHGWNDARRISEMIMDPHAVRHFTNSMNAMAT